MSFSGKALRVKNAVFRDSKCPEARGRNALAQGTSASIQEVAAVPAAMQAQGDKRCAPQAFQERQGRQSQAPRLVKAV
ncbi:hypothetical protein [Polaromonas sp. CG9_12]|nr:hypothetical protein [Polaromonas sp. CG9_12]